MRGGTSVPDRSRRSVGSKVRAMPRSASARRSRRERLGRRLDPSRATDGLDQPACLGGDVVAPLASASATARRSSAERRQSVSRLRREVRAGVERPPVGREEDGHRPAALAGHRHGRVHVERVDVGPLLAVDLHVDEALVHERRGRSVLERLVRHHVAPVAGAVADREQDRPVLGSRPRDASSPHGYQSTGLSACWQQVRARLAREAVHAKTVRTPRSSVRRRSAARDESSEQSSGRPGGARHASHGPPGRELGELGT